MSGAPTRVTGDGQVACTAGLQCDAQAAGRLQHALGRGALDLGSGSLGAKKVEQLVGEGVLRSAADLLDFVDARDQSLATLSALDGWGATSSEKVLDALETRAATPIPLAAFVFALGAPRIGKATAKRVANISGSWAALRRRSSSYEPNPVLQRTKALMLLTPSPDYLRRDMRITPEMVAEMAGVGAGGGAKTDHGRDGKITGGERSLRPRDGAPDALVRRQGVKVTKWRGGQTHTTFV